MSNIFDHLHIKRNTAGSSNELSLDVLDAARGSLDSKKGKASSTPVVIKPPKIEETPRQVSYHGVKGSSTLSDEAEVTKRKRKRRVHYLRFWIVAAFVSVALITSASFGAYHYYQEIQQFRGYMNTLVTQLVEVDGIQESIEVFVEDPYGTSAHTRSDLVGDIAKLEKSLDEIANQSTLYRDFTVTDADGAVLDKVVQATEARKKMFDAVKRMITVVDESATESSEISAVWNEVVKADDLARNATMRVNGATSDKAIEKARDDTETASSQMKKALKSLQDIERAGAESDLTAEIAYLQTRIEALDHAVATSESLLKGEKEKAQTENDAYNEADARAAEQAQNMPPSLDTVVRNTYNTTLETLKEDFQKAKDSAVEADALIRSYIA